ncbi:MAG: right-handed parallel beta-helix repeat-containing protein [Anaerolineales bacterium]|nr:right-handed parallel beta-helix repeat-containing protein [Anaerolineales bacterium]
MLALLPADMVKADGTVNDRATAINLAAAKLATDQNDDGGFAWRLTDPASVSSTNVLGISAIGILKGYELNNDAAYESAMANAYAYVVNTPPVYAWNGTKYTESTKGVDSFPDATFLIGLAEAADSNPDLLAAINSLQDPDITAADIANLAKTRWDNAIQYKGATQESPANGTATTMAQSIRDVRHNGGYDALIPWDLEAGVKAALTLHACFPSDGYDGQAGEIAAVIYASIDDGTYFDSNDDTQDEYLVGLTGGIEAFYELNINPEKADELTAKLLNLQQADGSWDYYGTTPVEMSVQSTAYAVMALGMQGDEDAVMAARKGADWLVKNQKPDGGWFSEEGAGDEFPEIDSEAAWALARTPAPVTINGYEYYSIQSAIDAASDGDTIFIGAGRYVEIASNGTVNPETLGKLIDFEGETDGDGNPLPVIEGSLTISLDSVIPDNVSVSNLNFEVTTADTLSIYGVNGIEIDNCSFDGNDLFTSGYIGVKLNSGSSNGNSNATITNSTFKDGLYGGIQGYVNNIIVENSKFYNLKSGINHQGGGNLVMTDTDISVEAQAVGSDTYGIRFAGSTTQNLTVTGGSFAVDKNGLTADAGTYHSAIIIRAAATGTLKVNGASINGEVVNQSATDLDAAGNWWGSASGPAMGQIIQESTGVITVCPWLNAEGGVSTYPVNNTTSSGGFCTIQAAVDAASTGDVIEVGAGIFDETINIDNFSDLTLVGEDASSTVVQPSTTLPWNIGTYGSSRQTVLRVVDSTDIDISNLTFDLDLVKGNYIYAGLFSDSTGSVEGNVFKNNQVTDTSGGYYELGLALRAPGYSDSSRAAITVSDNTFQDMGRVSLHVGNYVETTITGNTFYKTADDFGYGIELGTQSSGTISDNIFNGFDTPAASDNSNLAAIYVENCFTSAEVDEITKYVTISNNEIYDNQWGMYIGNEFNGYAGNVDIVLVQTGNNIFDNTDGGILIADEDMSAGSSVSVTGSNNIVVNNGDYGYYITTAGDGDITVNLTGEVITGHDTGMYVEDTGSTSTSSYSVSINNSNLSNNASYGINNTVTGLTVDASPNWWGSPCGPTNVEGDVDYDPWYLNEDMTATASAGAYVLPSGSTTDDMNAVLACALPDATITFEGGTYPGGLVVDNDDLTFNLNGATVGSGSPAFTINGDNITIQGPGTLDGNASLDPGILVNAGADNFILDGVEVTEWADGVQVAGAVESLKIVNNWMHTNTDAGLQVDAAPTGIVTIEGNLFKANGGNGVSNGGGSSLNAEYNAWGDLAGPAGTNGDGVGTNVDADPFTFVEFFMDVDPDCEALTRNVDESDSFDVKLKADAVNLYGVTFKLTYDETKLQLNSQTFSAPWASKCIALTSGAGELAYRCTLTSAAWSADGGDILTLNFTATGIDLTGNGPWEALFDISHLSEDASAGASGGAKVYVNNAGYGDPSITERDITDTDDGKVTVRGIAQFSGFVDLQGRANDAGATLSVYDQQAKLGSTLLANATSSSGGGYTTAYVSTNI